VVQLDVSPVRLLQLVGLFFGLGAVTVIMLNVVFDFAWDLIAGIFFLTYILLCGLTFGMAGLIAERPEQTRKLFGEWLVACAAILIWALCVYAFL